MGSTEAGMKNVWLLTICMTVLSICYTMLVPFLPVYLLELGVPDNHAAIWSGMVFSVTFLVAGIMAPVWGRLADTRGKKPMAIRAAILIGITYILTGVAGSVRYPKLWGDFEWDAAAAPKPETANYMTMKADEKTLEFKAFLPDGKQFDEVKLTK